MLPLHVSCLSWLSAVNTVWLVSTLVSGHTDSLSFICPAFFCDPDTMNVSGVCAPWKHWKTFLSNSTDECFGFFSVFLFFLNNIPVTLDNPSLSALSLELNVVFQRFDRHKQSFIHPHYIRAGAENLRTLTHYTQLPFYYCWNLVYYSSPAINPYLMRATIFIFCWNCLVFCSSHLWATGCKTETICMTTYG